MGVGLICPMRDFCRMRGASGTFRLCLNGRKRRTVPSLPLAGSDARTVETTGPAQRESCQEALTGEDPMFETQYEALRRQGISRRSFLQFCSLTAASLGIGSAGAKDIAEAMETKPRTPVIWLHGLECTCCTESFIRSYHPVANDLVLSMISLDYDDTIMQGRRSSGRGRPRGHDREVQGQLHPCR